MNRNTVKIISLACLFVFSITNFAFSFPQTTTNTIPNENFVTQQDTFISPQFDIIFRDGKSCTLKNKELSLGRIPDKAKDRQIDMIAIQDKEIRVIIKPVENGMVIDVNSPLGKNIFFKEYDDDHDLASKAAITITTGMVVYSCVKGLIKGTRYAWRDYRDGGDATSMSLMFGSGFCFGFSQGFADILGISWVVYLTCVTEVAADPISSLVEDYFSGEWSSLWEFIGSVKDAITKDSVLEIGWDITNCFL